MTRRFGRTELPERQEGLAHAAVRIEWLTIGYLAVTITAVFVVMGSSQAMKAAWIEDLLSLAPPIAFLVAMRIVNRPPTRKYPYGFHRSAGVAHLVAGVALFAMGAFLIIDSVTGLISAEHPPIGTIVLFGQSIWLGWLMIGVMALTIPLPIYFGRVKMRLAKELHDKVLYADADMNKADWMTAVGTIAGVTGIGFGLWWADSAAALLIAASILWDGVKNLRGAITDLMDTAATTFDDSEPHPLRAKIDDHLRGLHWVEEAGSRVRDQGHVLHVESFIVPRKGRMPSLRRLTKARDDCIALDWKIEDIVLIPIDELPEEVGGDSGDRQSERNR
ncbi:cation diffusion facilitator family transporter [Microbacterium ginsengiterrae]|uniref:Cation diffusion facilitator family transporter n=1 Tax=Microbacterium ginsengiterrae TaxID=546115 RepID=A0A7W9CCJ7_9MICO|nr:MULTISPECIES: cation diffusion facilitator family transporter [Microbacterium]MBB5742971.1 cation diffusion facilitator family transporter [Microbacterium ginsengiterrae]